MEAQCIPGHPEYWRPENSAGDKLLLSMLVWRPAQYHGNKKSDLTMSMSVYLQVNVTSISFVGIQILNDFNYHCTHLLDPDVSL